ncbi:hypothetical protein [Rhodococcus sp. NPDC076796]|uniref:hypothetical protein n=1 Tax=Rhodococcus sp. NPDC076796 TaxID=3154859 RepID=UPI0034501420
MKVYTDGWVQLHDHEAADIDRFWLDGFPVAVTPEEAYSKGRGPDKRVSPIYDYDDGGIGKVQWVNATHDRAAYLKADGSWKTGGRFHLWISAGAGTLPYEFPLSSTVRIEAGDPSDWQGRKNEAIAAAELALGLRPLIE